MNTSDVKEIYNSINHLSGDRLSILRNAFKTFTEKQAVQASASLAYYTVFSIFPLLIVVIAIGSFFLDSQRVFVNVTQFIQQAIPLSRQVINENLKAVLEARGPVGLIGFITLLWSASGMFTSLAYNINLAWPQAPRRNFFQGRLAGLGIIAGLLILISLSIFLGWLTRAFPVLDIANASLSRLNLFALVSNLGSWLMVFLAFLTLYHWIPTVHVKWKASLWSALTASILWKMVTTSFRWYLSSGLGRYQLVYGALGAIVAFLFLVYIISLITLFGAYLSAAIHKWGQLKNQAATD